MKKENKKLNDRPFEYRIRVKYLLLGFMLGSMSIGVLMVTDLGLLIKNYYYPELERTESNIALRNTVLGGVLLVTFGLLSYKLWYEKKPPRKHPENEPIGLKWDWDKVKDI